MALRDDDLFLVNRETSTGSGVWESFKTKYSTLIDGLGASIAIGDTAPSPPELGMLWYNTNTAITYIWYIDPNNSSDPGQWVDIRPMELVESGSSVEVGDTPPTDPKENSLWYNTTNGITYIWYLNPGTSDGQWVDVRPPIS